MKKNILKTLSLLLAGVMLMAAVGCSSSEKPAEEAATDERTIAVGMMASIYPYCFMDDDDNIVGYDVDMFKELDARMDGYTFTFENLQYAVFRIT